MQTEKDTTAKEVERMLAGGMKRISPRQLRELLDLAGYQIHKPDCFNYTNSANEITYKARAMGYMHKTSGMRYAHIDAPRDTLPKLQEIRHNCFVFERGRVWEL